MPYFYCQNLTEVNSEVQLSKEESLHINKTLRLKVDDTLTLINGQGLKAQAVITFTPRNKGQISCRIKSLDEIPEPTKKIHLYLASPRHNILSGLIRQCVELGVWEIHFIDCEFSVAKPKDKKDNLLKDIIAGAKQSGNCFFPKIQPLVKFSDALKSCRHQKVLGAVPQDNFDRFKSMQKELSLWIGPEGGFSTKEKEQLKEAQSQAICIGDHILRVETATVGLLSILNF